ncbi:hypothetical protein K490DRAFT_54859 [Saccharata proteae CBS 121410]|uniref:F-box domain-containing protein n=1 Tax=Saccharata proteae CBS 121410 TaxID=1314787 RepID=A0A6A5YCJ2_9PEZI|nr:hypothetical protein K490DRAFT_54859 [Saccharata proteae CBS 121410]
MAPHLPIEVVLNIVECMLPSSDAEVALEASHCLTRTLISLALTSRATYSIATRSLYTHCLFIDSSDRLSLLLRSLRDLIRSPGSFSSTLPHVDVRRCLQQLYLAPFMAGELDVLTAKRIYWLFSYMRLTLRRLVIDMPLRALSPENDRMRVRPILRDAFELLRNLEEFVSARDDLYLATEGFHFMGSDPHEPPVWWQWTSLRRLALYDVDFESPVFQANIKKLKVLEDLVMDGARLSTSFIADTALQVF